MLDLFAPDSMIPGLIVGITLIVFTFYSLKKKQLNFTGTIFANIVGLISFILGGLPSFLAMALFYLVAESATKFGRAERNQHEQRTSSNVIGNAGAAMIALILGQVTPFFGAVAAALSDTVSSELGLLSKKKPVLITTFQQVEKGTDGGITLLGLITGLLGAGIIGILYYFTVQASLVVAGIIILAGFLGSLVDSILGATLERKGILTNTYVNFFASSSGAIIVFLLTRII